MDSQPDKQRAPNVTIRDWPWIITTGGFVLIGWGYLFLASDGSGQSSAFAVAALSIVLVAIAWVPHVTVTEDEVQVRRLTRIWVVPIHDLVGIDVVTSVVFRQRVPRLVLIDGTGVLLPPCVFTWSRMSAAHHQAINEIRRRASAAGNELTIAV